MTKMYNNLSRLFFVGLLLFTVSCERDLEELELATASTSGDIFIDAFTGGLQYAAFGGSDVTAFEVDTEIKYAGTTSMRFAVPDFEDPAGAYAGGAFFTGSGRDLSGFNALTFWARASQAANIDIIGFGNDLGANEFVASVSGLAVNTNWKKYYIPIPDPSKLTSERGMLFYSEGPEEERGYTFWIDEVKFENLGTVVPGASGIFNGEDRDVVAATGDIYNAEGFATFNLPRGVDQRVSAAPAYFEFSSSNETVATVNQNGVVTILDEGTASITATLGGAESSGSLNLTSTGAAVLPATAAPTPDVPAEDVISIFSNTYTDVPVDFYNGFWQGSATQSEIVQVGADDIIRYTQLDFVGIQFTAPTINATGVNRIHLDIWTPDGTDPPANFKVKLEDIGPDGSFGGNDDSAHEITITSPTLQTGEWVSLDFPLTDFPGLTARANLALVVLSGDLPNVFVDNLYLYNGEPGTDGPAPETAAPAPIRNASNVISLFSDAYTDVTVDTWRTDWSMAAFADVMVDGNPTKKYSALNFAGITTEANQVDASGMTHFHLDVWSGDFTEFAVKLVDFGADGAFDGGDDTEFELAIPMPAQNEWVSLDLPLSDFTGLINRNNIAQYVLVGKPSGVPTVFVDNIYFYNDDGSGSPTEPTMAAPTPSQAEADVISIFSDAYTDVTVDTWRTDWSSATFEDVMVSGDPTKKYSELDFVGIETVANQVNASGMTHFHLDVWSGDFTNFAVKLVDFGADGAFDGGDDTEFQVEVPMPAQAQWVSLDLPLSDFTGLTNRNNIAQYVLVGQPTGMTTVFVDNIYFYNDDGGGSPTEPTAAAPTPSQDAADVISLFSEAYTDVTVDTWRTDWSSATFEDVMVAGNATKKYSEMDFAGIETVANQVDASDMTHFHLDVWSGDFTNFAVKLVDFGADGAFDGGDDTEFQVEIPMPAQAQWVSLDLPLSDFTGLTNRNNIAQYVLVGQPTGMTTVFVDNIYFYKAGGGGDPTEPSAAAPAPTFDAANVISLFSDVYTDVTVDTWRTDWSAATFADVMVAGNATKKYSELDFVGIETVANTIDATSMTHFSVDVWTADATVFAVKLVDFGADGAFGGGDDVEHQINFEMPAQGEWISYDIPLSDFTGLTTRANMAQYILVGQPTGSATIFVDNMLFRSN